MKWQVKVKVERKEFSSCFLELFFVPYWSFIYLFKFILLNSEVNLSQW